MILYWRLATHEYASLLLRPITDDQAPGYSSFVHRHIDLLAIKKNIETEVISTTTDFQHSMMLMFLNSIMYSVNSYLKMHVLREKFHNSTAHFTQITSNKSVQ